VISTRLGQARLIRRRPRNERMHGNELVEQFGGHEGDRGEYIGSVGIAEYNALTEEARYAGRLTPEVFHLDLSGGRRRAAELFANDRNSGERAGKLRSTARRSPCLYPARSPLRAVRRRSA
jgi:hypothetical protein